MVLRPTQFACGIAVYLAVFTLSPLRGQSLQDYQNKESTKIDSTINSLKEKTALQYLSLAPNISYSQFTGLNIGVNIGSFVSYAQTKRRNKIDKIRLETQLNERLETQIEKAAEKEIYILDQYEILVLELDILKSKRELFVLDSLKYSNQEITFSQFTTNKISYQVAWKTTYTAIKKLNLNITRFYNKYGYKPTETTTLVKTAKSYETTN